MKSLLFTLFVLCGPMICLAQDTIVDTKGSQYLVHLVEQNDDTLYYRTYTQPEGRIRKLPMDKVAAINHKREISEAEKSAIEASVSTMLPGYDEVRPYLVDKRGVLNYYHRVGHHKKWYMAYSDPDNFTEITRNDATEGCVSKKKEFYQFMLRDLVRVKRDRVFREGDGEKFFVLLAEGNNMILCTKLLDAAKTSRVHYGNSTMGATYIYHTGGARDPNKRYYFYDGEYVTEIYFTVSDIEQWKQSFTECPGMVEALNKFSFETDDLETEALELLAELATIFQNNCYVQIVK